MKMENRQRVQDKKQKFYLVALPILLLLVILAGSGVVGYQTYSAKYHNYVSLAQTGIQHLRTAATLLETLPRNPFDSQHVSQAQHEFAAASTVFIQLDNDLTSLPGISTYVPVYGAQLR